MQFDPNYGRASIPHVAQDPQGPHGLQGPQGRYGKPVHGYKKPGMSPDRWAMIVLAAVEFIAGVVSIVEGVSGLGISGEHGTAGSSTLPGFTNQFDPLQDLRTKIGWGVALNCISLLSLMGITAYYTVGRKVQHYNHLRHFPLLGSAFALKVAVIVLGAVGIVAATAGSTVLFCAGSYNNLVPYKTPKAREDVHAALSMAAAFQLVCLVLKLLEAVLGHVWALTLHNYHMQAINK